MHLAAPESRLTSIASAIVVIACALVCTPRDATALGDEEDGLYTRGSLEIRYRLRASLGSDDISPADDQDFYEDLFVEAGYGPDLRIEGSGRLDQDIDGRGTNVFSSIDDTYSDRVHGFLYTAFVEANDLGILEQARIGRQFIGEDVNLRFDGVRLRSAQLAGVVRVEGYGGLPAHLYESSPQGDWLAGAAVEVAPSTSTVLRLDYAHLRDRYRHTLGRAVPTRRYDTRHDDLIQLTVRHRVCEVLRVRARAASLDWRSVRLELEPYYFDPEIQLLARVRYTAQLGSYRNLSVDLGPLDEPLGGYEPYHEVFAEVRKELFEGLWLGGGAAVRVLTRRNDEGAFNHEFLRVFALLETIDLGWEGLSTTLLAEHYESDEAWDRTLAISLDVTQELMDGLSVSVGTAYDHYVADEDFLDEREHVRSVFASAEWRAIDNVRLRVGYSAEFDDEDVYHVLRAALRLSW